MKNKVYISVDMIRLFMPQFSGRTNVYGTHDSSTGRSWQVKTIEGMLVVMELFVD